MNRTSACLLKLLVSCAILVLGVVGGVVLPSHEFPQSSRFCIDTMEDFTFVWRSSNIELGCI
jgi:hypothetical protein